MNKTIITGTLLKGIIGILLSIILSSTMNLKGQDPTFPYPIIFVHGLGGNDQSWDDIIHVLGGDARIFDICLEENNLKENALLDEDVFVIGWRGLTTKSPTGLYLVNFDSERFEVSGHDANNLSNQSAIFKQGYALKQVIQSVLNLEVQAEKVILVGHSMGGLAIREYLQRDYNYNWLDPNSSDGHKVAKVITIGTPHRGSDITLVVDRLLDGLLGLDVQSEAVRDLRWDNSILRFDGKYLFGGNENDIVKSYYNYDINCNGTIGENISGLNEPNDGTMDNQLMGLPNNIKYTWIVGTVVGKGTDLVVDADRQWLYSGNTPVPYGISDTLHISGNPILPKYPDYHRLETRNIKGILRGLDEPGSKDLAYKVNLGVATKGYITHTTNYNQYDQDVYKVISPGYGKILFRISTSGAQINNIAIKDQYWQQVAVYSGTLPATVKIDNPLPNAPYYLVIQGTPSGDPFNSQYSFEAAYAQINNGVVLPETGSTTDEFTFSVLYKSIPGQAPDYINLKVDGTLYQMTPGGSNWQTGIIYTYSGTFPQGPHNYHFEGSYDGIPMNNYPVSNENRFYVEQSAVGWDALVDPVNTNYSPSIIKPNTTVTITTYVRNNGSYTYNSVPVRVEMKDPQGNVIGTDFKTVYDLTPGNGKSVTSQIIVSGSSVYGSYSITSCAIASLDGTRLNDCFTQYFYIGENLSNEQFRNTVGQKDLSTVTPGSTDTIRIKGKVFRMIYVNNSEGYANFRDPGGDVERVDANQINIYGAYDALIQGDAFYTSGGIGYGTVTGYYAYPYGSGAVYDNVEINGHPGTTAYAFATARSGNLFSSVDDDYELYSTSTTQIKDWYDNITKDGLTYNRIRIEFDIPADATIGKTTLYFRTPYSSPANVSDMTRLTFYITNPLPVITSLSKTYISADDQITITGNNLGTPGTVSFSGIPATSVMTWTNTSITCTVPQGIEPGILTVINSNGTSNGMSFTVLSQTGIPELLTTIPAQELSAGEVKVIADLDNIFRDPNGTALTFIVNTNNPGITYDASALSSDHLLILTGTSDLLNGSQADITATDASDKSVSTSFNVSVPAFIRVNPASANFSSGGGTGSVEIISNIAWEFSLDANWITGTKNIDLITLDVQQNNSVNPRSAILTVTGGGIQNEILINQDGLPLSLPEISEAIVSNITLTTVNVEVNIASDGGLPVTSRGVCWSTDTYPTISLSTKTLDGSGTEPFTSIISGLSAGTTYYIRAYATNGMGTSYSDLVRIKTYQVKDADNNYYSSVEIGSQVWLGENLRTTKYSDGTAISNVTADESWNNLTTDAYCWYKNDASSYKDAYGAMYNWFAVNTQKLCPAGWHVPSDSEWHTLALAIDPDATMEGTESLLGGKLKETGTIHWTSPNTGATNESGFTGLPGGNREDNIAGGYDPASNFEALGIGGCWWTSTEYNSDIAWYRNLGYNTPALSRLAGTNQSKKYGYSVRCVKNTEQTNTIGITEVYSLSSTTANRRAQTITFTEPGTIQSISIYHNGGTGQVLLGVYADAAGVPGARLGVTPATTISSSPGWQTVLLTSPAAVASGQKVWLSWVFENNPGIRYISGTPARAQSAALWSGGMPDPFGTSSMANYRYSVYCTYIPGASDYPNLRVSNFSAPASALAGGIIGDKIQLFIENQGSQVNESFSIGFYISSDTIITTDDYLLTGGREFASGINQGAIIEIPLNDEAIIPENLTSGEYYIGALIDEDNRINESVETDNFYSLKFTVISQIKTLGITEIYNLSSTTANRRAQTITFTEPGTIQSISIYHNGGTGQVLLGVYADAAGVPGARLGVIPATTINTTAGWQTVSLTSPVSVTSGQKVWLSWVFENNPGIRYITGTPARAQSAALWTGGMPDPFGSSTLANYRYSIYCTYTTETGEIPELTTSEITALTRTSALSGGNITNDGGSSVTVRGVCWSTNPNPTVDLATKTTDGTGTGIFISSITGLNPGTTYYLRAYATNSTGTAYGNEINFETPDYDIKESFVDNFLNLDNWILYGSPDPQWISSIQGRDGVFDNNGDSNYNSGAISESVFSFTGKTIESDVYLDFNNLSGCWVAPSIGIANPTYQTWGGYDSYLAFTLAGVGDACSASPGQTLRHAYIYGIYLSQSGWRTFGDVDGVNQILADNYANKWTNLKIVISVNGIPSFYADDNLIYTGTEPLAQSVLESTLPLWLGERSSGFAGKAYHDNISVSIDKTLGNTEVYSLSSTTANRRAQIITFTESATIQSISIYHNGGTGQVLLGIYADATGTPGARLGVTPSTAISSAAGWQTISLASPVPVTSGQKVWLSWVFQTNPGVRYMLGTPARAQSATLWAGGMPDPFGTATFANYKYSIYCTYIPGGTETKTNGITEVYTLSSTTANRRAQTITFTETGTIQSISIYHNGGTGNVLLGVYADAGGVPGARLGVTPAITINSTAGWQTVSLTNPVTVNSGQKVWLSWVFQNNPGVRYVAGTPARAQSAALWSGGMPDPFGTSSLANYRYSIYCTYITSSSDEIKPMNEPLKINSSYRNEEEVLIYPNPAYDEVTVTWKNNYKDRLALTIYDLHGRPVKTLQVEPDVNEIYVDLSDIRYGIYLFELKESGNSRVINRSRIIKY